MSHFRPVGVLGTLFAVALSLTLSAAGVLPAGASGSAPAAARSLPAGATACRSTQAKPSSAAASCVTTSAGASTATVSLPAGSTPCPAAATKPSSGAAACAGSASSSAAARSAAAAPVTFVLKLSANPVSLAPGGTTTLTATSSQDVAPTPFFIEIFDATAGTFLVSCGSGTSCATSVTQSGSTVRNYIAYVTDSGKTFPPPAPQATSNTVTVSWLTIGLNASPTALQPGGTTTLTATSTLDVATTPFFIEIFDATAGALVVECGFGTTCSTSVTQAGSAFHAYVAYVSDLSTTLPPPDIRAQSSFVDVTWISLGLAISPTSLPAGNAASVTATASLDVGPTPFFIEVFDQTTGALVAECGFGATCSTSVTQSSAGQHLYTAFVADASSTTPPPDIRATSNTVAVTWTPVTVFVTVPNVRGDTESEASQALQAAGLVLGDTTENGCIDDTHVYVQTPGAGSQAPAGSSVSIGLGTPPVPPHVCP